MRSPKRLDAAEKQQIAVLAAEGKTPHAIGKIMGRSENTVAKALRSPEVALQKADIQERLADKFERIVEGVLDRVTVQDIEKASLRDKAVSAGVLLDKARLLRGQATSHQSVFFHIVAEACRPADADEQEQPA